MKQKKRVRASADASCMNMHSLPRNTKSVWIWCALAVCFSCMVFLICVVTTLHGCFRDEN